MSKRQSLGRPYKQEVLLWGMATISDTKVCWPCGCFIWRSLEPVKPFTSQIQKVAEPFPEHLRPWGVREVAVQRAGIREKRLRWVGWGTQLEKGRVFCSLLQDLSCSGSSAPLVPLLGSGGGPVTSPLGSSKSMHLVCRPTATGKCCRAGERGPGPRMEGSGGRDEEGVRRWGEERWAGVLGARRGKVEAS